MKAIDRMQFKTPTPIQQEAIPLALQGQDLIACAQTGTGKTAAFVIPLISKILEKKNSRALIVTPTRELALQVAEVVFQLTGFCTHIRSTSVIGGASMNKQFRDLSRNPSIVIGTPGRIVDHLKRQSLDLRTFDTIVLDEADRMFDMGFADSMNNIFNCLPQERQTLLFSATFSPQVSKLAQARLKMPKRITIGSIDRPVTRIEQIRVDVENSDKNEKLLEELYKCEGQVLVFVRTKHRTDRVAKFLDKADIRTASIHGGRTQSQRKNALEDFKAGDVKVLCATDVASRGIDISDIRTVFNFDLPETAEDYIHRIGRTARAGAEGKAISFVTREEERHWNYLVKERNGEKMNFPRGGKVAPFQKSQKKNHRPKEKRRFFKWKKAS